MSFKAELSKQNPNIIDKLIYLLQFPLYFVVTCLAMSVGVPLTERPVILIKNKADIIFKLLTRLKLSRIYIVMKDKIKGPRTTVLNTFFMI